MTIVSENCHLRVAFEENFSIQNWKARITNLWRVLRIRHSYILSSEELIIDQCLCTNPMAYQTLLIFSFGVHVVRRATEAKTNWLAETAARKLGTKTIPRGPGSFTWFIFLLS